MRVYGVVCILAAWIGLNATAHAKTVYDYVTFHKGESKKYIVIMMPGTKKRETPGKKRQRLNTFLLMNADILDSGIFIEASGPFMKRRHVLSKNP
jgi:hypothetical protein